MNENISNIYKLIKSYLNNTKIPFAFYDNIFNLILMKKKIMKCCNLCKEQSKMEIYYSNVRNCPEGCIVICPNCNLRQLYRNKDISLEEFYINDEQDKAISKITKISKIEQIESEAKSMHQRAILIQDKINELKILKKEIKIIDVGGGYGNLLIEIRKLNNNNKINILIDILEPRKLNDYYYTKYNLNKITQFLDDSFVEKYKNSYDLVLNYHVLEHVINPVTFLSQMYQLLRQDGYLCLEVPNDDLDIIKLNKKYADRINYIESHENYFTKDTLSKTCKNIGINPDINGFQIYGYENYNNWLKDIPNKVGKEIDFFTNNYKENSDEYKWYNKKINNLTCDTIYFIYKKLNNIIQKQYLKIKPNVYELNNVSFNDDEFYCNNIKIIQEMQDLYFKMNNNASGDWKWISDNKVNINTHFENKKTENLNKLYSNFARNSISFGLISNGIYQKIKEDNILINNLKQKILNDIDTCIELCDINNLNLLDSVRIGNFYGIIKDRIFITPDNIRHYYSAYKINNFLKGKKKSQNIRNRCRIWWIIN